MKEPFLKKKEFSSPETTPLGRSPTGRSKTLSVLNDFRKSGCCSYGSGKQKPAKIFSMAWWRA